MAKASAKGEERDGVPLTNLDQPLFDGGQATKRDLIDYLDAVHVPFTRELRDRPLSVIRVRPGQPPFMQKNLPKYTPGWIPTAALWADSAHREVTYALANDRRTLLWLGNQRAVEYHPGLAYASAPHQPLFMIMDIDPPEGSAEFGLAVRAAHLVKQVLDDAGLKGAVKTSGSKGVHIFIPATAPPEDLAAATRAIAARAEKLDPDLVTTAFIRDDREGKVFLDSTRAGGATVVAAYSPRLRPGLPVSFPVRWEDLDSVTTADFTIHTVPGLLAGGADPWAELLPKRQNVNPGLIGHGHTIPVARVQAMHEGKRRARARREADSGGAGP